MKVVVFGGAGYIGGVTSVLLQEAGHEVIVVDNLSTGHREYVDGAILIEADILDHPSLSRIFEEFSPDVVMNFAAKIQVAESMQEPYSYLHNNCMGAINIVDAAIKNNIKNFVLSSTAAVYGNPSRVPIHEDDIKKPINPYGLSKYMVEQSLESYGITHSLNWVAFRYFNAAGAYKGRAMDYPVMSHLIPHATEAMLEKRAFKLYGNDYPTKDGTCVRDFVHVIDIAKAHIIAAEQMESGRLLQTTMNLGSGTDYTVLEVLQTIQKVTGQKIDYSIEPVRSGDPAILVADSTRAKDLLQWSPELSLEDMITSHVEWRNKRKQG